MNKKLLALSLFTSTLLLANIELETITVTEEVNTTQVMQKASFMASAPSQKQFTTKEALKIAGTNGDPLKALSSFAGIVSTSNDNADEIYIHGSKPRETSFSINHLPLGYVFHLGGLHSVIAPEATSQIDAYLGGFDVTYDSMGAVVDVMPKYPTGSNSGHVHIGLYDASFAYDAKLGENTALFIGARRSYFDLIADEILDELNSDDDDPSKKTTFTLFPQFQDAQLILTHNYENHMFSFEALYAKDAMKLHTTLNRDLDPVANGKIENDMSYATYGLRWQYEGESFDAMTLLSHFSFNQELDLFDANYYVDVNTRQLGIYHETLFHLNNHKPLIGFEIYDNRTPLKSHITNRPSDNDFRDPVTTQEVVDLDTTFKARTYTLFAQDIWSVSEHDHIRYGVRATQVDFQEFGATIDPRFAYVRDLDESSSLSLSIGKYSQFPEITYVIEGFGNPLIDTSEFATHYTLNYQKTFANGSKLELEPYYKTFENLAINSEHTKYEAVGKGKAYGVDVTYTYDLDPVNLIFAYTYVKAQRQLFSDDTKQYRFLGDIPHTLQLSANYDMGNNWRISGLFRYSTGRPFTPIVGSEAYQYEGREYYRPLYGSAYSERMPDTYDLDIQIGKTYKYADGTSLEYSLELMNINALIKPNIDSYTYNAKYERDGEVEQLGFLPGIHVTYRF